MHANMHFASVEKDTGAEAGSQGEERCFSLVLLSLIPGVFHFHNSSLNGALPCRRSTGG